MGEKGAGPNRGYGDAGVAGAAPAAHCACSSCMAIRLTTICAVPWPASTVLCATSRYSGSRCANNSRRRCSGLATCSNGRRSFSFADTKGNANWFRQCQAGPTNGYHFILGVPVPTSSVEVVDLKGGGAFMNFTLPPGYPLDYSDIAVFSYKKDYSMACTDTDGDYEGTTARLAALARYALVQCR